MLVSFLSHSKFQALLHLHLTNLQFPHQVHFKFFATATYNIVSCNAKISSLSLYRSCPKSVRRNAEQRCSFMELYYHSLLAKRHGTNHCKIQQQEPIFFLTSFDWKRCCSWSRCLENGDCKAPKGVQEDDGERTRRVELQRVAALGASTEWRHFIC